MKNTNIEFQQFLKKLQRIQEDKEKSFKIALGIAIIIAALIFAGVEKGIIHGKTNHLSQDQVKAQNEKNKEMKSSIDTGSNKKISTEVITVDISGMVRKPGVYTLSKGSRLNDVVQMAGGLLDDADINVINRAEKVQDAQKIYIPKIGEEDLDSFGSSEGSGPEEKNGLININNADSETLQKIKGVGPATAEKIIEYRKANGKFRTVEDLKNVSGIGEKTFEKIKDTITV